MNEKLSTIVDSKVYQYTFGVAAFIGCVGFLACLAISLAYAFLSEAGESPKVVGYLFGITVIIGGVGFLGQIPAIWWGEDFQPEEEEEEEENEEQRITKKVLFIPIAIVGIIGLFFVFFGTGGLLETLGVDFPESILWITLAPLIIIPFGIKDAYRQIKKNIAERREEKEWEREEKEWERKEKEDGF